ncbi:hypothetical protein C4D60_Mb01t12080 [Musa balbisiana]|uniref:Uncharacterized protein n=1 Tax=Musa balbisiana TaxID=52838 RepID=A0A4S8JLY5_MUSBA|nr:hypothetical protein C4D60_Mb01t12080 [Musa balbisiana]
MSKQNEKLTWQTTPSPEDMALRSTSPNAMTMDNPTLKPQANTSADITIFVFVQYAIRQSSRKQMLVSGSAIPKRTACIGQYVPVRQITALLPYAAAFLLMSAAWIQPSY